MFDFDRRQGWAVTRQHEPDKDGDSLPIDSTRQAIVSSSPRMPFRGDVGFRLGIAGSHGVKESLDKTVLTYLLGPQTEGGPMMVEHGR